MARTNKYTSLNFNDIYEKKITTTTTTTINHHGSSPSSSSSAPSFNKTLISNSRIHGNMLVLTRPSPKPLAPPPQRSPPPTSAAPPPDMPAVESDPISLRPLGRTGAPSPSVLPHVNVAVSPKNNKFVPPHLRPGFHGREEKPEPEIQRQIGVGSRGNLRQSPVGSPMNRVDEGRPKSGGGYERVRGGFEANSAVMNRPRSSGSTRPYSSG